MDKLEMTEQEMVKTLSRELLRNYYEEKNNDFILSLCTEDIIWHGGGENLFEEGIDDFTDWISHRQYMETDCRIVNESYISRKLAMDLYLCQVRSELMLHTEAGEEVKVPHCITFIFRSIDGDLRLAYIHSSMSYNTFDKAIDEFVIARAKSEQQRSERRFIHTVGAMYTRIYEAELHSDDLYVWKHGEKLYDQPVSCGKFGDTMKMVRENYVSPDFWRDFDVWIADITDFDRYKNGEDAHSAELMVREEGRERWIALKAQLLEHTADSFWILIFQEEIGEKKQRDLAQQKQTLEALQLMYCINEAFDLIISVNLTQNNYYMINYDDFLNRTASESGVFDTLIEVGVSTVPDEDKKAFAQAFSRENLLAAYERGEKSVYLEHRQFGDDGKAHWMATHVMFAENPYNDDILEMTVSKCIDGAREKEEEHKHMLYEALELAENADHAKSDFLARMSHDIRTPLNAITGMTTIAKKSMEDPKRLQDCLTNISESSQYLLGLVNDILDMSQIENGKMTIANETFDFDEMIRTIVNLCRTQTAKKNQSFQMEIEPGISGKYMGDSLRIRQILMNLLSNAHKYTDDGGKILLYISKKDVGQMESILTFQVCDNGRGIPKEFQKTLFEPFSRGKDAHRETGSGLGLAITQSLVHLMNGNITLNSEYGRGTTFVVELPLKRAASPEKTEETESDKNESSSGVPEEEIQFHGEKLLLAEDNEINREIAVTLLEMQNLVVDTAVDGADAVEKFSKSQPGEYCIILMDIQMPKLDGYDATRCIRELEREDARTIPIYAMTANAFPSDISRCLLAGMNGHLSKPANFQEIAKVIQKELENRKKSGGGVTEIRKIRLSWDE